MRPSGEGKDYKSFKIGLFGLDKLHHIDRTVRNFEIALDQVAPVRSAVYPRFTPLFLPQSANLDFRSSRLIAISRLLANDRLAASSR